MRQMPLRRERAEAKLHSGVFFVFETTEEAHRGPNINRIERWWFKALLDKMKYGRRARRGMLPNNGSANFPHCMKGEQTNVFSQCLHTVDLNWSPISLDQASEYININAPRATYFKNASYLLTGLCLNCSYLLSHLSFVFSTSYHHDSCCPGSHRQSNPTSNPAKFLWRAGSSRLLDLSSAIVASIA